MSTTTTTVTTTATHIQGTASSRLRIGKDQYPGLDTEWIDLWNAHGAHMVRADELSIQEYRKNPAAYSFTYPTCPGKISLDSGVFSFHSLIEIFRSRCLPCRGQADSSDNTSRRNHSQGVFTGGTRAVPCALEFSWRWVIQDELYYLGRWLTIEFSRRLGAWKPQLGSRLVSPHGQQSEHHSHRCRLSNGARVPIPYQHL